jgi:DHA2 family multidrug resistance protein
VRPLALNLELLVVFRVLQGTLAGPMIPLSQSLLLASYPDDKKAMAMSLWAMTVIVAPIFGPILGGWISDNWNLSWIFYINIPVGFLAAGIAWKFLRHRETPLLHLPIDRVGLSLLVLGVGSLQLLLDRGKELDWFNSTEVVVLCLIAVIALTNLVIWELYDNHPVVDLSLFKSHNFTVGGVSISVGYFLYFGAVVLMPLLLQTQVGYTATQAGLATAPVGILPVILSPIIGKNAHRLDLR